MILIITDKTLLRFMCFVPKNFEIQGALFLHPSALESTALTE